MSIRNYSKLYDQLFVLTFILFFTGGIVIHKSPDKPWFEFSSLVLTGLPLFLLSLYLHIRGYSFVAKIEAGFSYTLIKKRVEALYKRDDKDFYRFVQLGLLFFVFFYFVILLSMHFSLNTGFDTAIFDQALFNSSQGKFHYSQIKGEQSLFSDHVQVILFLLLPFYYLYASPLWLFFFQALSLFFSGIALLKLCRFYRLGRSWHLLLVLALVCNQSYRGVILNDFHPISFIVPCFLFFFYFLKREKLGLAFLFAVLSLACKEHIGIYTAFFFLICFF